ncbi:MAG: gliding motility-associated C-terminal domain-containing protein, partial [Saprospiraceae bacterium]
LTASGGSSYLWSTGATTIAINVSPAVTTTYTVTATDANGCSATASRTVTVNQLPNPDISGNPTICLGQSANLTATGGGTYLWSTGETTANISVTPTATTIYTVTVTSATNGCTASDNVLVIIGNGNATANAGPDQTICAGQATLLNASGGGTYLWSTGATTASIMVQPNATTTYTVTVSAGAGCTGTDEVTVNVNPKPNADITGNLDICSGQPTTLTATGGSIFMWSNGSNEYWITVNPSVTTTYTVTVSAGAGCTATDQVTVNVGPLNFTLTATAATCDAENGSIQITAAGGNGPFAINWGGTQTGNANDPDGSFAITALASGNYNVTVTNAGGCSNVQQIAVPQGNANIVISANNSLPVPCFGGANGEVSINLSGGSAPYIIRVDGVQKTANGINGLNTVTGLAAGNHAIEVADANGCTASANVTVTQPAAALSATNAKTDANCCGENGSITVTATGGTPTYSYAWPQNVSSTNSATGLDAGNYVITVTDANGCTASTSTTIIPDCDDCQDIITVDSIFSTPDDTITVCLPGIEQSALAVLEIFVDGSAYQGQFHGCAYDTLVIYNYAPLLVTGPTPYRLIGWSVNGSTFADSTIANVQELVDSMNIWDPTGGWQVDVQTKNIVGGTPNASSYGAMNFVNLNNWTPSTLNPNYGGIATGTSILVPGTPGKHTIVLVDPVNCCRDTVCVFVSPNANPAPTPSTMIYTIRNDEMVNDCFDLSELPGGQSDTWSVFCDATNGTFDVQLPCFNYTPDAGFVGTENLCVEICGGGLCDTFYLIINVLPTCTGDILTEINLTAQAPACDQAADVCLDFPLDELNAHLFFLDGQPYTGGFAGCDFDSAFAYLYSTVPDLGAIGPYTANWSVNGAAQNTTFGNLADLVAWMNSVDPTGNWAVNASTLTIEGGSQSNTYGSMQVLQTGTGGSANLDPSLALTPNGTSVKIPVGTHTLIAVEIATACSDTVSVVVSCPDVPDQNTEVTVFVGENGSLCFAGFVTNGATIASATNVCPASSGTNASASVNGQTFCLDYKGLTIGKDTACIRICLSTGQCFVLGVVINVLPKQQPCTGLVTDEGFTLPLGECSKYDESFCVDVPFANIGDYALTLNGAAYTDGTAACNYNATGAGTGTELRVREGGDHVFVFTEIATGCTDTVFVAAPCVDIKPAYLVADIFVGDVDTVCVKIDDLPGSVQMQSLHNPCPSTDEYAVFDKISSSLCYRCTGVDVGEENVCFVICDDLGFCDTTFLLVRVHDLETPPIAVTDYDSTLTNQSITIPVLKNDTIPGGLATFFVSRQPQFGVALKTPDNKIYYTPNNDHCDDQSPDEFEYVICNSGGCDTARVFVWVYCDKIKIFDGFSPNGDGMNDVFFIEGLHDFPNNHLTIFNRWGMRVLDVKHYDNSWDGTWRGEPLLDGAYFYILDDGKGNEYRGYLHLQR